MTEPVLVADIGGTNARFGLATRDGARWTVAEPQTFRAEDFETIRDAADAYIEATSAKVMRACFAIAGPAHGETVTFTNSPWVLEKARVGRELELDAFRVVNDFEALAAGVLHLPDEAFVQVKAGAAQVGAPKLVIGPGTGLGQALLVPFGEDWKVVPTEGGHVTFAPRTAEEVEVMQFIAREHPRVSVERILSGRGLVNLHRALCVIAGTPRVSLQANEITEAAKAKSYPIAVKAVDLFCGLLGAVAGDAVLGSGSRGGVVLGGGILPKIQDIFLASAFTDKFLDKGRMKMYLEPVPVDLIVQDGAALLGAAALLGD